MYLVEGAGRPHPLALDVVERDAPHHTPQPARERLGAAALRQPLPAANEGVLDDVLGVGRVVDDGARGRKCDTEMRAHDLFEGVAVALTGGVEKLAVDVLHTT